MSFLPIVRNAERRPAWNEQVVGRVGRVDFGPDDGKSVLILDWTLQVDRISNVDYFVRINVRNGRILLPVTATDQAGQNHQQRTHIKRRSFLNEYRLPLATIIIIIDWWSIALICMLRRRMVTGDTPAAPICWVLQALIISRASQMVKNIECRHCETILMLRKCWRHKIVHIGNVWDLNIQNCLRLLSMIGKKPWTKPVLSSLCKWCMQVCCTDRSVGWMGNVVGNAHTHKLCQLLQATHTHTRKRRCHTHATPGPTWPK